MTANSTTQPDIKLVLDDDGAIRRADLANTVAGERFDDWLGLDWSATVEGLDQRQMLDLVESARRHGVSHYVRVHQRFPSGLTVPFEYLAVRLKTGAVIAVGRDVRGVAQLQSRLAAARTAIERNYWQLREFENRYRVLFESTRDALAMVRAADFRITEANPAAIAALGLASLHPIDVGGQDFLALVHPADRDSVERTLRQALASGRAPRILARFGSHTQPLALGASLLDLDRAEYLLVSLADAQVEAAPAVRGRLTAPAAESIVSLAPDGMAVLDEHGTISSMNPAFLALLGEPAGADLTGRALGDWCDPAGTGLEPLLDELRRVSVVRHFPVTLHGSLGRPVEVDLTAVRNATAEPAHVVVYARESHCDRETHPASYVALAQLLQSVTEQLGNTSLKGLVGYTVALVEKHYIETALAAAEGNRTAAARMLGITRQTIYHKILRHKIAPPADSE